MNHKKVSKCGAKFTKKEVEFINDDPSGIKQLKKEAKKYGLEFDEEKKPIQKKTSSWKKKDREIGVCDFVNLENENVIGVSDTNIK